MLKETIVETVSSNSNEEFSEWYAEKVMQLTKFFVKNVDPGYLPSANSGMTCGAASQNSGMTKMEGSKNFEMTARQKELIVQ